MPNPSHMPRKVREVLHSANNMAIVESDAFFEEISDAIAAMVFPHFGLRGWREHYTGYSPIWALCPSLPIWMKYLDAEIGWGVQKLFLVPSIQTIPFFAPGYVEAVMERVVKRAIKEENLQPTLDVMREMPCDEDFENWDTNIRKDFMRRWYHTRSKKVQMVSLEDCLEDETHRIYEIADPSINYVEQIVGEDFYQRFKALLFPRDMEILEYRMQGLTYEAIAERMGYSNHSGVLKRMSAITKAFIQYERQ